jgi:hypothetical protein
MHSLQPPAPFLPLRHKYSPQQPVLKHPQSMFFPAYKITDTIMV